MRMEKLQSNNIMLKVASKSDPNKVARAIAGILRTEGTNKVEILAIGAGAINQAIKSIAIARGYMAPQGIDLTCTPAFDAVGDNKLQCTVMRLIVKSFK